MLAHIVSDVFKRALRLANGLPKKPLLRFETKTPNANASADELTIYLDATGVASLMAQLGFLKVRATDHVHLTSAVGGAPN